MKKYETAKIITHIQASGICTMNIFAPEIANMAKPGHFVMVYLDKGEHLLPRPISIYDADKIEGCITLVYAIVGAGTKIMSQWPPGHNLRVLGPLGNGFDMETEIKQQNVSSINKKVALVGGGIGTAPLFFLAKELNEINVPMDIFLGFRQSTPRLSRSFENLSDSLTIVTEEGGGKNIGYVTDFLPSAPDYFCIFSCGPTPMFKALAQYAKTHNIPCQISVEERMACGLGACKGCVVKTQTGYQLCCESGPVFDSREVLFDA